jgi:putative cyclase
MLRRPFARRLLPGAFLAALGAGCAGPPPQTPGAAESLARIAADRILDLSYPFDERTIYWPTAAPFRLTHDFEGPTEAGFFYASNSLCASEHGGTHLDAPYHFYEAGRTTDGIPPRALIARACVIDARAACASEPDHAINVDEIRSFEATNGPIPEGAVAILFTGWGALARPQALPGRRHSRGRVAPALPRPVPGGRLLPGGRAPGRGGRHRHGEHRPRELEGLQGAPDPRGGERLQLGEPRGRGSAAAEGGDPHRPADEDRRRHRRPGPRHRHPALTFRIPAVGRACCGGRFLRE